ncbi:MAG: hybrid sensor histidine kinase/response regulator, partial [Gammaproteobacteria bacterium]
MASLSFRTKTILGIAVIESLMLIALVWSGYQQLRESTNEQIAQRAQTTVALFATLAKDPILAMDLASLESFTQEMVRNPGV